MKLILLPLLLTSCTTPFYFQKSTKFYGEVNEVGTTDDKCLPYYAKIENSDSVTEVHTSKKVDHLIGTHGYYNVIVREVQAGSYCPIVNLEIRK